jgi:hypothetical protein
LGDRHVQGSRSRVVWGLLFLAGCTTFDSTDDGDNKKILLGKTFTISLPASEEKRTPAFVKEAIIQYRECRRDPSTGMDVFEFKAVGLGETEIRIPKGPSLSSTPEADFVLTARVVLAGSPY